MEQENKDADQKAQSDKRISLKVHKGNKNDVKDGNCKFCFV